ncbi:MAG: hypothetical protein A3C88_00630 [Candidatus Yanofskybacteria bacterium RIFCSPHIGHO2_02_FULL_50_12]|uniref:Membrane insertase YidC/Oxa/ALB C-terminal domain-containing protein n=1 Tax=Candidatus Yanofskybacteria bacterium RIFCSPHIGHO2_02_FULL_50_12 TaxID=1802685 RepID=A0A1F8FUN5_9BACT|nr:MAG: hypothetical protein A3C88_00630 [Candidatus Yanofskybacteria bacterium RIFCSPHIGHO2_02_FULL_50_12]
MELRKQIFYIPLFNLLILLFDVIPGHDLGVAIIVLTILIRLVFFPLSIKAQRSQRAINLLAPKIKEIKEKFQKDQAAQGAAIMALYKEHGVNPVAGCLPLLIQLPILIALYQVFIAGLNVESLSLLYPFIPNPGTINPFFLGVIGITNPNRWIAVLAAAMQFVQSRQSLAYMNAAGSPDPRAAMLNKQMMYLLPAFIIVIGWNLPAGLLLYWVTTTAASLVEQWYLKKTS